MKYIVIPALVAMLLLAGCSSDDETKSVNARKTAFTECSGNTRDGGGEEQATPPMLRLTRQGDNVYGELLDYRVNCSHGDVTVSCHDEGTQLNIGVNEHLGDLQAQCLCPVSVYFTIFNVAPGSYTIALNGLALGTVELNEGKAVELEVPWAYLFS